MPTQHDDDDDDDGSDAGLILYALTAVILAMICLSFYASDRHQAQRHLDECLQGKITNQAFCDRVVGSRYN